jgi:hypothetical protein
MIEQVCLNKVLIESAKEVFETELSLLYRKSETE